MIIEWGLKCFLCCVVPLVPDHHSRFRADPKIAKLAEYGNFPTDTSKFGIQKSNGPFLFFQFGEIQFNLDLIFQHVRPKQTRLLIKQCFGAMYPASAKATSSL